MIFQQLTQQIGLPGNLLSLLSDKQYNHQIEHLGKASMAMGFLYIVLSAFSLIRQFIII